MRHHLLKTSIGNRLEHYLDRSRGVVGIDALPEATREWLGPLASQLPTDFTIHNDAPARAAAAELGALGVTLGNRIALAAPLTPAMETVLRHELVHLLQIQLAARGAPVAPVPWIEHEARSIAALPRARDVRFGAAVDRPYCLVWFVAMGAGAYVLFRPSVANTPGPGDETIESVSTGQVLGEAFAIFAVPGGAMLLGGRLKFGFLGSSMLAGGSGNVSLRGVDDISRGKSSPPLMYLYDAGIGAGLGFVVPGGIRLIGQKVTLPLDWLATRGLVSADIKIAQALHDAARTGPIDAKAAHQLLQQLGLGGKVSKWWLDQRNLMVLYRGQGEATEQILSPLARKEGVVASRQLVERMRALGVTDDEIASFTAVAHDSPLHSFHMFANTPRKLVGVPAGAVGIPTTRLPGLAASYGDEGVVYVIRMPKNVPILPKRVWKGLEIENEWVILNELPHGSVIRVVPASKIAPIDVDEAGRLIQTKR